MDRSGEVKLLKGFVNEGELFMDVGRVNRFRRGWAGGVTKR